MINVRGDGRRNEKAGRRTWLFSVQRPAISPAPRQLNCPALSEWVALRRRAGVAVQRRRTFNYLARRSVSNCCVGSSMMLWYGVGDPPSARLVALPTPVVATSTGGACRLISVLAGGLIN